MPHRRIEEQNPTISEPRVLQNLHGMALIALEENVIATWSENATALTGHVADTTIGAPFSRLHPTHDEVESTNLLQKAHAAGRAETTWLYENRPVRVVVHSAAANDGHSFTVQLEESSDARLEIESLRLRERALNAINSGIIIADARQIDCPLIYVNPGFEQLTGYTPGEVLGRNCRFLQGPQTDLATIAILREAIREAQPCRVLLQNYKKSGVLFWNDVSITPLHDDNGTLTHFVGILIDVTEQRLDRENIQRLTETFEERVTQRTAEMAQVNDDLEAFSYSVSHDLRAPLRHISGFADMLEKRASGDLDAGSLRYLHTIIKAAHHAGNLVDDLLEFSRMGRSQIHVRPVDMRSMVENVISSLRQEIGERNIEWQIGDLPQTHGDPAMISLVWQNLISNAVKYSRERETAVISISAENGDRETEFTIHDNGAGFDMRYVDKLFGVFQRLHSTSDFEGTGIGLANVKRIVERHGGVVRAESHPDAGTTFCFTLPHRSISNAVTNEETE
ncbi:MAG TPA: ATP-binding protein [Abditibacteriaceae bacterium]|jgi:PAS domain S-box-containing protein